MSVNHSGKVAVEFESSRIEEAFEQFVKEKYEFELIGQGIVILSKDVAEKFLSAQNPAGCKEVEIVSLYHLPRNEANRIRKRHLQGVIASSHS